MRVLQSVSFLVFLAGVLLVGVFGTWTVMTPMWLGAPLVWGGAVLLVATAFCGASGRVAGFPLLAMLGFAAWVMARGLTSPVAFLAEQDLYFAGTALIGYLLTAVRFGRPWQRFAIASVWGALIVLNCGLGLYQMAGHSGANPLWFLGIRRDAADAVFGGFFPNSNHLSGFMELTAFPLLGLALCGRIHSFVRLLCSLVFAAAVTCVVLSTSRGGLAFLVGLLVLSAAFLVLRAGRSTGRRTNVKAGMAVVAGLVVLCAAAGLGASRVLEQKFGRGQVFANLNGRGGMWERGLEQWQLQPLTGTGARSYEYYERYFRNLDSQWVTWGDTDIDALFAHNDWLQLLADYGLVGFALAGVMLLAHAWRALVFAFDEASHTRGHEGLFADHRPAMVLGAAAGLCAFAVHCAGDFQMHVGINALTAAMLLGMIANPGEPDERGPRRGEAVTGRQRGLAAAALLTAGAAAAVMAAGAPARATGDYHFLKAMMEFRRAEGLDGYLRAAAGFARAAEAHPGNAMIHYHWGMCDLKSAEEMPSIGAQYAQRAVERFRAGLLHYPQHPYMAMYAGRACDALQRYDEAEAHFQQALRWGRGARVVNANYGDHLVFTGQVEKALTYFSATLHRYPEETIERAELQAKINYCQAVLRKRKEAAEKQDGAAPAPASPSPAPAGGEGR